MVCWQLALYVLTFLAPRDLLEAAQTCRYWRILAEDNLLWREKCREEGKHTALASCWSQSDGDNGFIKSTRLGRTPVLSRRGR